MTLLLLDYFLFVTGAIIITLILFKFFLIIISFIVNIVNKL